MVEQLLDHCHSWHTMSWSLAKHMTHRLQCPLQWLANTIEGRHNVDAFAARPCLCYSRGTLSHTQILVILIIAGFTAFA